MLHFSKWLQVEFFILSIKCPQMGIQKTCTCQEIYLLRSNLPLGEQHASVSNYDTFLFLQPGAATSVQRNGGTLGQKQQWGEPHKFIKLCIFVWCLSCSTRSGYLCNTVQHGSRDCMYIQLSKFDCVVSIKWIFKT